MIKLLALGFVLLVGYLFYKNNRTKVKADAAALFAARKAAAAELYNSEKK
jgi:hypothetical protein